jgi:ornithine carbamoyltransferase
MSKPKLVATPQTQKSPRHFLDLNLMSGAELRGILNLAVELKADYKRHKIPQEKLNGRTLAMIFEKPSTRTRVSFQVAMNQLSGHAVSLRPDETQLGRGETIADTARVLSRYVDAIMIRTHEASRLYDFAEHATVPVINGLTADSHPCQIMADVMTFEELKGPIKGRKVVWCGDGNNVANSWIHAAVKFGFTLVLSCPDGFLPPQALLDWAHEEGGDIELEPDIMQAASNADCVVTDTWSSMGFADNKKRIAALEAYQVNAKVMRAAKPDAIFMHCLPAHREEEVTGEVLDGPQSVVLDEAENRLHIQKGILCWCLN